jgi:hypothetical protein
MTYRCANLIGCFPYYDFDCIFIAVQKSKNHCGANNTLFHDISYYLSQWQISHLHHNGFLIFEQRLVNIFFFKSRKNDTK